VTVRGAAPSGSPEAREAVRSQKIPVRARLVLRSEERDFSCDLVAQRLAIAGGAIPAVLSKDSDDAFLVRNDAGRAAHAHVESAVFGLPFGALERNLARGLGASHRVLGGTRSAIPVEILAELARSSEARARRPKRSEAARRPAPWYWAASRIFVSREP